MLFAALGAAFYLWLSDMLMQNVTRWLPWRNRV